MAPSGGTDAAEDGNSASTAPTASAETAPPAEPAGLCRATTRHVHGPGRHLRRLAARREGIAWLVLGVWMLLLVPVFLRATADQRSLIDFLTYRRAADALVVGDSPYESIALTRDVWLAFHQLEATRVAVSERTAAGQMLQAVPAEPQRPGPYLYPPTLAWAIATLNVSDRPFAIALGLAILGFTWLWLRSTGASSWWLLLVVGSWDVLASWIGGNVEHLLLLLTLVSARLLWTRRGWLAAAPAAIVLLVKPFYLLFFVAFALLQVRATLSSGRRAVPGSLAACAGLTLVLVGLEVTSWGPTLRAEALRYFRTSLDRLWFALPLADQTPMSAWNRTPLQVLVQLGLASGVAQWTALGLWAALVGLTLWRVEPARLSWARSCALAFVLLYLGRPVGWGLIYFEFLIMPVVWPDLRRWYRGALLVAVLAFMGTHWWALALTAQGRGLPLLTLQSARWPWETLVVLPLAWWLLFGFGVPSRSRSPTRIA
jgi:hypothetical protein